MRTLSDIAKQIDGARVVGPSDVLISGITHDSRKVSPGFVFAALKGENVDGTAFVRSAVSKGAVAILCESPVNLPLDANVSQLVVSDARAQLGQVAAAVYGHPSRALKLIGITGTNGKTTITYLVETILQHAGIECGVMGTVMYRYRHLEWQAAHTTPESTEVQGIMRDMVDAGATALAMEVSSHGLVLGRLNGCEYDVVAFTNLTQDHLDFHHTMADYGAAKMHLFTDMIATRPHARVVVNLDDDFSKQIIAASTHEVTSVSVLAESSATLHPIAPPLYQIDGTQASIQTPEGVVALDSRLCGSHNLSNLLVAAGICRALNVPWENISQAMKKIPSVPGRLERVPCELGFSVFVDYAHTPDALFNVLRVLKPLTLGRLICVFGCGGDRDGAKRPLMGEAVGRGADMAIVTSDNPRTENPADIIDMVIPGVKKYQRNQLELPQMSNAALGYIAIQDRRQAIEVAVGAAQPGDTVLLAGKGHEDYVIIGKEKFHFDDREEAKRAIAIAKG
ncbi:MAG: UDP-N-acetylmuramoyl-L-alanyl-D-glutamate--2,6-diaminopimelate ligase [Deltaproteobacteria bacterium]|nr:UDP-N-acetylmuramoyl-L-alanyl-D-glutamate--2,6-diaminopimelate ligase [Deltaproteobacteria bacterium]